MSCGLTLQGPTARPTTRFPIELWLTVTSHYVDPLREAQQVEYQEYGRSYLEGTAVKSLNQGL